VTDAGHVKIYRSLLGHPAFRNDAEAMAFAWLVIRAAWKPARVRYKGRPITLARGQLAVSQRDMAQALDRDKAWVERLFKRLKGEAMVEATSEAGVSLVTICKYDDYQAIPPSREAVGETGARQAQGTEQEGKKYKKKSKDSILSDFDRSFAEFWKAYPRKDNKKAAEAAYRKALKGMDHGTLVAAVDTQRHWQQWREGFIPHAATWLNNERWRDEPSDPRQVGKPSAGGHRQKPASMVDVLLANRAAAANQPDLPDDGWLPTDSDGVFVRGPEREQPF